MAKAPPLVCKRCDKDPSEHIVRNERLTCPGTNGSGEWEYTDDRLAWDLMQQLNDLDARKERLTRRLFELVEKKKKKVTPDSKSRAAVEDFLNAVLPTMEGYDEYGQLIDPEVFA
jgi:hypothetical protein